MPKVAILDGGLSGYKASGAETTKAFPTFNAGSFKPSTVEGLNIYLDELLPLVGRKNVVIVDPRPKAQFEGTDQTFIRNGHIPGARNIPWQLLTEANNPDAAKSNPHKLKSIEDLRALFVSRGITPDKTVIISCSTGREASLQFLALKHLLKYPNVRIYEGSWTEYSASPTRCRPGQKKALPADFHGLVSPLLEQPRQQVQLCRFQWRSDDCPGFCSHTDPAAGPGL